jgi:hypothetical protein
LRGDNIKNSSIEDLEEALEKVILSIKDRGVDIDISEATIKYIEINKNIHKSFDTFEEVFLAMGRASFKKSFGYYTFLEEDIHDSIKRDKSLYINLKRGSFYNPEIKENAAVVLAYDKSLEVFNKKGITIDPLTRIEFKCGRDFYRREVKRLELDHKIETLIKNPQIINILFKDKVNKALFNKTEIYIQKTLKKNLDKDFKSFKRTEILKKKERQQIISKGEKVPIHLKEERGIFEYLKNESWIFDVTFLKEVIRKNMTSKNIGRDLAKVEKNYGHIQNYKLFKELKYELC